MMDWFKGKTILVPVDFSDESLNAVKVAQQVAKDEKDIHVIHITRELPSATYPGLTDSPLDDDLLKREAKARLVDALCGTVGDAVSLEVRSGSAGHEIVDYAKEINCDLIIMPSHGRSGLSRVLLGSVTERVTRHAPCPVLVLRPTDHGEG